MQVMISLFELVYSGENAFHITMTNFYMIDITRAPEIQSILGFEWSVLVNGLDNPRYYFLYTMFNHVAVTNSTTSHVLSMSTGYYTIIEFIEAVNSEMVMMLSIVSMMIEEENVKLNDWEHGWYFDNDSDNTTINGFG